MQDSINNATQQLHRLMEPTRKMNALILEHTQKIAHLNIEAARSYTDLAMEQMRSALEVRDPEGFQSYLSNQGKVAQTVSNKVSEDVSTLADIGKNMGEEVQKLAQENVSVLTEAVQGQQTEQAAKASSGGSSSTGGTGGSGSGSTASSSTSSGSSGSSKKSA